MPQVKATKPSVSPRRTLRKTTSKPQAIRTLRIVSPITTGKQKDRTATHLVPSGLGGVFRVEVIRVEETRALVRIHMPKTEWHHWQGDFWVDAETLRPI